MAVAAQSNSGSTGGGGLNPSQFCANEIEPDEHFKVTQQIVRSFTLSFGFSVGSRVSNVYRSWQPFNDTNPEDNFIGGDLLSFARIFNYYRLVNVSYTFAIGACWYPQNGPASKNMGWFTFRALPWTGKFGVGNVGIATLYPNLSVLTGCENWFINAQPVQRALSGAITTPTMWQRQATISIDPQFQQDTELGGGKPNFNQSPLQLYTEAGRDNTTWRGIALQLEASNSQPDTTAASVLIHHRVQWKKKPPRHLAHRRRVLTGL